MQDINKRLDNLEQRLFRIESALNLVPEIKPKVAADPSALPNPPVQPISAPIAAGTNVPLPEISKKNATAGATRSEASEPVSTTQFMAWAAGFTLLLAAVYFLKIVYDVGWLTPSRQIGLAAFSGIALIVAGLQLSRIDRIYAAYMPALGLVILYLTVFVAHLHFHVCNSQMAIIAVGLISITGLWLGRKFDNSVYALFSTIGVYITPLLVHVNQASLVDLIIYYSAWSLLFSFSALHEGRRTTYMLPMFFSLLGFDLAWRASSGAEWQLALIYQFIQFTIFALTAVAFSVLHRKPFDHVASMLHGAALLYFYALEYINLKQHLPAIAPTLALLSAVLVYAIYFVADKMLKSRDSASGAAVIVSVYCSLVTVHTVFFEWLSAAWFSWGALVAAAAVWLLSGGFKREDKAILPIYLATALVFVAGFVRLLFNDAGGDAAAVPSLALCLYSVLLYAAYFRMASQLGYVKFAPALLYAAHLAALVATTHLIDSHFAISLTWAVFAVCVLITAIRRSDRALGQSSLLIFAASGLKVLLYDLADSGSMLRVLTLIVLGVSLYVGGWLYQQLVRGIGSFHDNPLVNRQIGLIKQLYRKGMNADQITRHLLADDIEFLGEGDWTAERVQQIIADYRL